MNTALTENLRRLRLDKGYTQERLAEELGVSAQMISRWERGNTLPDVLLLPKLARFYGVTVDDLYRENINAYPNYAQRLLAVYESTGRSEDFLAAEQEFSRLLAGEHTADDLRSCGVLYHYMTKHCAARAEGYLDAAMAKADRDSRIWASAAQQKIALCCDLGRGGEEAARYEAALGEDPADPQRWVLAVAAYTFSGSYDRADALVQEAVERFPDCALLHVYAGDVCKALGHYDSAFLHWRHVRQLDERVLDADYAMGGCYEELGQYGEAYKIWSELHRELLRRGLTQESRLPAERAAFCLERIGQSE